ncbi:MAG: hypothetical protein ABI232_02010 [Jatrophihabitantaceae bacterium]
MSAADQEIGDTPPQVVGAIAAGVAPLPFLGVYAVLFLIHGSVHPVIPPDITNSKRGEFVAGVIALALFVLFSLSVLWLLNRRRRWVFVICQAATLGTAVDFVIDRTTGSIAVSALLLVTSAVAFVLSVLPQAARHVHSPLGGRPERRRASASTGT